ncbi:hypothetical protein FD754_014738 [Muntiacus muntjak]|uniref:Cationic amino acid transporter C-terminal domain-containing protein n=1 Tax=Muntiacus muntjak TaxID=9888 RepID=A0A5N3VKV3_MUNMU|nr:hypothetical protein FD754_014738 [Muntiacus muntjak]
MSRMLCQYVLQFGQKLVRRLPLEPIEESESPTAHLNILDLVVLGVGRSLGAGVYILIGFIAKFIAGPSVVLCFVVDSLSSVLFGLCYAELGARIPHFTSLYLCSYVTMGQLCTFVMGWNLILSLFVVWPRQAWSIAFDSLTGNHISQVLEGTFSPYMPSVLATFPDFVALGTLLLITGVLILGVPVSAWIIKVFTSLNILIPIFMVVSGFIKGDLHNWQLTEQDYRSNTSGSRILHGAAIFFRSYFGFDVIVIKGREARNPQRSIPLSIVISIFICFLAYSGVSASLTLMVPYYQIHHYNPLPLLFSISGGLLPDMPWLLSSYVPFYTGQCHGLLRAMFVLSRLICTMADDGLLFRGLGWIHARTHSPIMAILASGTLAAIMALPFELRDIVEFMLIGIIKLLTPLWLFLYQADQNFSKNKKTEEETEMGPVIEESPSGSITEAGMSNFLKSLWFPPSTIPTQKSGQIVYGCAFLLILLLTILSLILAQWPSQVFSGDPVLTTVAVLLLLLITGVTAIIWSQPQDPSPLYFKVGDLMCPKCPASVNEVCRL